MQKNEKIPNPQSTNSFVELTKDLLFSSAVMETNFHLLYQSFGCSDRKIREIIGDAPRKVNVLLSEIDKFINKTMGKAWTDGADKIVTVTRLSIMGLSQNEDENISVLKINHREENFRKFVFEFQIGVLVDPLVSFVAKTLFEEYNFIPTNKTAGLLKAANVSPRILYERKHNNFILNLCDLDEEVDRKNLTKGDKRFDVLDETIHSLISFGSKIKLRDGFLSAPIDYACY